MVSIEVTILRYFTEFVWKRIPPINHQFCVTFLNIYNIIMCILMSLTILAAGGGEEIIRLQGYPTFMKQRPIFHPQ